MKLRTKLSLSLVLILSTALSYANSIGVDDDSLIIMEKTESYHLNAGFTATENGDKIGRIELKANGKCTIINYEDDITMSGTYDIREEITIGGQTDIYFYIDGETYKGEFVWPLSEKMSIIFDGLIFVLSRR